MTSRSRVWRVRIAASAEADYRRILIWTAERFGLAQMHVYDKLLVSAFASLMDGPTAAGARAASELPGKYFKLHVGRRGRGRHFIVFRFARDRGGEFVEVVRILHDSMDVGRHLP